MFVCYQGADISIKFVDTPFIVSGKPFDFLRKGGVLCQDFLLFLHLVAVFFFKHSNNKVCILAKVIL